MPEHLRRRAKKAGLPPGTLVHVGKQSAEGVRISVIDYSEGHFTEISPADIADRGRFRDTSTVTWINVEGVHQAEVIANLGQAFAIHPLVLEDIMHTSQRPKLEDYGEYLFLVLRMIWLDGGKGEVRTEQVSLVVGSGFVLSFQESRGEAFAPVLERLRNNKGRLRQRGADYLAYTLVDAIVDNYFVVLEGLGEDIEAIEVKVLAGPAPEHVRTMHLLKRQLLVLRRAVWPLREVLGTLERGGSSLIAEGTEKYLRDLYDHTIEVIDTVEAFRDMVTGLLDLYLSSMSNRLNEVMKVLTIIATIFMPLTFIAGIYGMNFRYMPELEWRWGYPGVWLVIALVCTVMVFYFKRKRWI